MKEFDIDIETVRKDSDYETMKLKHVYNIVKMENGKRYMFDLEDDLEYIQSGAKTRKFGVNINAEDKNILSEDEIKKIDIEKVKYIPEGYYLEDMLDMLHTAVNVQNLELDKKLEMILNNLNVYTDNSNTKYRERIKYYSRIFQEILTKKENNKVHLIDCYKKTENGVECQNFIALDMKDNKEKIYVLSNESNEYYEGTMEDISKILNDGFLTDSGIPGFKRYLNKKKEEDKEI